MTDSGQDRTEPFELSHKDPSDLQGADALDDHERHSDKRPGVRKTDSDKSSTGIADEDSIATTSDGGLAVDGGKLPGNRDDFEHELDRGARKVPGADADNRVVPPNDRDLRM